MILIKNIGLLVGIQPEGVQRLQGPEMSHTGVLRNAWLCIENGTIADFGGAPAQNTPFSGWNPIEMPSSGPKYPLFGPEPIENDHLRPENPAKRAGTYEVIDAQGGMVMPAFCDSHTHLVYSGSRDGEFLDKLAGMSYEEIAKRGGGILNSSDLLHSTSEDELYMQSMVRVNEVLAKGTGTLEIKSGYGLNPEDELKMLRVIKRIKETTPAQIKITFLGAHAIGRGYTHEGYVQEVIDMMPRAAEIADFADVFCDKGFFTVDDTARILEAGKKFGLTPKIHANELAVSGGVQVGVQHGALSVDHLEQTTSSEIEALKGSATMPTMLPGSSFFLGLPYGRAKDFINAGLGIALASDYNPGSTPSGDMRFVMAMGCIKMRLTPIQAFNAVTINGAYAMGASKSAGSITPGKRADLIITRPGWDLTRICYTYQTPFIDSVILSGKPLAYEK